MQWEMPEGVSALYFQMPWGDVLRIYCPAAGSPSHPFTHCIPSNRVGGFLEAMGATEDKQTIYENMVRSGYIQTP